MAAMPNRLTMQKRKSAPKPSPESVHRQLHMGIIRIHVGKEKTARLEKYRTELVNQGLAEYDQAYVCKRESVDDMDENAKKAFEHMKAARAISDKVHKVTAEIRVHHDECEGNSLSVRQCISESFDLLANKKSYKKVLVEDEGFPELARMARTKVVD